MADKKKREQILLKDISAEDYFAGDLYIGPFWVQPASIPFTAKDLEAFALLQIKTLELEQPSTDEEQVLEEKASLSGDILHNSLQIMQQSIEDTRKAQVLYNAITTFAAQSLSTIAKGQKFPNDEPTASIHKFIAQIRTMGFAILRFQEFQTKANYLEMHAAHSFILSVALGLAAKIPAYRLVNLATAALFHEVGLSKFPALNNSGHRFTPEEFEAQKAHVQEGVNLLRPYNLPTEVKDAILQHHERLDGSGYPYGIAGKGLSPFAKYLGLVCSYVAMTTDQKFRESRMEHVAILTLLRGAKNEYDPELVRLFVQMLSLYPIGSYVQLSNGTIGKVLYNNPKDPRLPTVQLLLGADQKPFKEVSVVHTSEKLKVEKAIPHKEIAPILDQL